MLRNKHAFTLVELSIVLVILGLLVGGVLSGQSLIRASELRAVTNEHQRYVTAVNAFRDKYMGLPGDLDNAESFWGTAAAGASACSTTTGAATCNGDGDGRIEVSSPRSAEIWRFWEHLAKAGLIEGQFTGIANTISVWGTVAGVNAPISKISRATWAVVNRADAAATGGWYASMFVPQRDHWLVFGNAALTNAYPFYPILKGSEAWNIDTKTDDGKPGTGTITTMNQNYTACATSNDPATALYYLQSTENICSLMMGF